MNSQWHCISQQQSWKKGIEKYAKYWMKRTSKLSIKWEVEKEFSKRQSQKGNEGQIPIAMYDFSGIKNVRQQFIVPYLQIYRSMILMTHNKWLLVLFLHHDSNVRFLNKRVCKDPTMSGTGCGMLDVCVGSVVWVRGHSLELTPRTGSEPGQPYDIVFIVTSTRKPKSHKVFLS